MDSLNDLQLKFCLRLQSPEAWLKQFYFFKRTLTCVKNLNSEFVFGTPSFMEMCGTHDPEKIYGKTDRAFFPLYLADQYIEEDQAVFSGEMIVDKHWMVPERKGVVTWCQSSKLPIQGKDGSIIGLMCTLNNFYVADDQLKSVTALTKAIKFIERNYSQKIKIEDCAEVAKVSMSTLNRNFRKVYQTSIAEYLTRFRIHAACHELKDTTLGMTEIALNCGFFDLSHFSKQFKKMMRMTPMQYRKQIKL
jgi:AraC-like DNA-binding protein